MSSRFCAAAPLMARPGRMYRRAFFFVAMVTRRGSGAGRRSYKPGRFDQVRFVTRTELVAVKA